MIILCAYQIAHSLRWHNNWWNGHAITALSPIENKIKENKNIDEKSIAEERTFARNMVYIPNHSHPCVTTVERITTSSVCVCVLCAMNSAINRILVSFLSTRYVIGVLFRWESNRNLYPLCILTDSSVDFYSPTIKWTESGCKQTKSYLSIFAHNSIMKIDDFCSQAWQRHHPFGHIVENVAKRRAASERIFEHKLVPL